MMHASTSPFYPLFAALDINARMHEGQSGRNMWMDCVVTGIEARKLILQNCQFIRPFVPETVDGRPWESWDTAEIATDLRFFHFVPGERWHAFEDMPSISILSILQTAADHARHQRPHRRVR